jgi:hypothetical protein
MTYSIDDIAELIHYHLVLSEDTDSSADASLGHLVSRIEQMRTRPLFRTVEWLFCDSCGCAVDTELVAEDGSNYTPDGSFLCSDCLYPDED